MDLNRCCRYVRPGTFLVAVRMVTAGEKLPKRVKLPWRDLKIKVATCQAIAMARRYGHALAAGDEDLSCPLTAVVLGFRQATEYFDEIIVPQRSGKCEVILPCYGDRIFAQTQDHEMAFAVPAKRISEMIESLEGSHRGGLRYPIPSFLRYTGEFPSQYAKVAD